MLLILPRPVHGCSAGPSSAGSPAGERVRSRLDAVLDLEDIWGYVVTDSIDAAERWIAKLFEAFEHIARMPGIGHRREDLTDFPLLFWTVSAYLIIYRAAQSQPVEIVAVTQGSRDIPAFLRRRLH